LSSSLSGEDIVYIQIKCLNPRHESCSARRVQPAPGRSSSITCCAASRSVGSLRARAPLLMAIDKLLCEKEKNETHAVETHTTACTTSVMTALVGISSLSTPGNPSARVGPTLRYKTGFRHRRADFSRLYNPV
jgi:hypothetical protein